MKMRLIGSISVAIVAMGSSLGLAQEAPTPPANVFAIPSTGVSFITGDTWEQNGQRMRLYGVQSCIRGSLFTNAAGARQDCGEASLAMFAALVRDTHPTCSAVAKLPAYEGNPPVNLVICAAHIGANTPDLGTVMVVQGFGFAAFTNQGEPVYKPYSVAEELAKKNKSGLWAYPDFIHPNAILFKAVNPDK
jgi:endonuclease YncB( thermonuclease family)